MCHGCIPLPLSLFLSLSLPFLLLHIHGCLTFSDHLIRYPSPFPPSLDYCWLLTGYPPFFFLLSVLCFLRCSRTNISWRWPDVAVLGALPAFVASLVIRHTLP